LVISAFGISVLPTYEFLLSTFQFSALPPMFFLLLNQFYPPDPAPTGQYLHDLAQALVARGHEVQVLCSRQSYDGTHTYPRRELLDGVSVSRLWATGFGRRGFLGKLADYASFYGSLAFALLFARKSPDLILSLTTPPYLGLLGKLAARRHRCRQADWVMDLYPDVMFAHGLTRQDGWLFRVLAKLSRFQLRRSTPIIALGPTMAARLANYVSPTNQATAVRWLPLWSDAALTPWPETEPNLLRAERHWPTQEPVFLYSGNMGLGHCFTEFLEAARHLGAGGPRWVFAGGGKRRAEIESFARTQTSARIELLPYAPKSRLREHLASADVHLMSLDPAWQGFMVPSKLQASFAMGIPVLYVGGQDCETATWIQESGGGWVVGPNDLPGLLHAITEALDPVERKKRGRAARAFAEQHFRRSTTCTQLAVMLEAVVSPAPHAPRPTKHETRNTSLAPSDGERVVPQ
jgi:colanic acid biosynthesis glycosyl transferase WcaI